MRGGSTCKNNTVAVETKVSSTSPWGLLESVRIFFSRLDKAPTLARQPINSLPLPPSNRDIN